MPQPDVFGQQVTPHDVEQAAEETIRLWFPTYLREAERHEGFKVRSLPNIKSFRLADTMEQRFPEQQIPAMQIMLTSTNKVVIGGEEGHMVYGGTVDIMVQSTEPEPARRLASLYSWYCGLLLQQRNQLMGTLPIEGFGWSEHSVPAIGKPHERWLAVGSIEVAFAVKGAFNPLGGPLEQADEPKNWPIAKSIRLIEEAQN